MHEKLFVSYAKGDSGYVEQALAALRLAGWLKQPLDMLDDPVAGAKTGSDLRSEIKNVIGAASKVVLLWTSSAAQSDYVNYEAGMADALGKQIIVVFPEETAPELPVSLLGAPVVHIQTTKPSTLDPLAQAATVQAKVFNPTVDNQISHWAKIGKIAEENPDLSFEFINSVLRAREEALDGQVEPYSFG